MSTERSEQTLEPILSQRYLASDLRPELLCHITLLYTQQLDDIVSPLTHSLVLHCPLPHYPLPHYPALKLPLPATLA